MLKFEGNSMKVEEKVIANMVINITPHRDEVRNLTSKAINAKSTMEWAEREMNKFMNIKDEKEKELLHLETVLKLKKKILADGESTLTAKRLSYTKMCRKKDGMIVYRKSLNIRSQGKPSNN
jgi:hypothetical protein